MKYIKNLSEKNYWHSQCSNCSRHGSFKMACLWRLLRSTCTLNTKSGDNNGFQLCLQVSFYFLRMLSMRTTSYLLEGISECYFLCHTQNAILLNAIFWDIVHLKMKQLTMDVCYWINNLLDFFRSVASKYRILKQNHYLRHQNWYN